MRTLNNAFRRNPTVVILAAVLLILLLVLVALLVVRALNSNRQVDADATPTALAAQTATPTPADSTAGNADPTPTNTPVVSDDVTASPTATSTPANTAVNQVVTSTPNPATVTAEAEAEGAPTATPTAIVLPDTNRLVNVLQNGTFEFGYAADGVANGWQGFHNGSAVFIFTREAWPPAIKSGNGAQRITIVESAQGDRYAGIYQTVDVVPGGTYRLTLNGQIRSTFGDVVNSNYGYRMQYAVDRLGGTDWQSLPESAWVELPWDEQLIDGSDITYLNYQDQVQALTDQMTVFIRVWSKWPDKLEAQYTLDDLSLFGPSADAEPMLDQALPETGNETDSFWMDPRFWVSLFFLGLLFGSALWQLRRRQNQPGMRVD